MVEAARDGVHEVFRMGGVTMPFLVAATMLLWYGLGYRLLTLRRGSRAPFEMLLSGKLSSTGLMGTACRMAAAERDQGEKGLRQRLDLAFGPTREDLGRFSTAVRTVVLLAPLLGLLGTVIGMIETFDSLATMSMHSASGGGIAGGISEALFTTQMGLVVAVPGHILGRLLDRKQEMLEDELSEVVDYVCARAAFQEAA